MPRRNRFEMAYARIETMLCRPLADLEPGDVVRLRSRGFMDLVCESIMPCEETGAPILSLTHYFEQNGDLCQDPEMTIRLFHPESGKGSVLVPSTDQRHGRAEALTFQQAIPPIYHVVYPEPGTYRPRLHQELNEFLGTWLRNLKQQGHAPVDSES
ncbi:MAG: hypothetical protein AAGE94_11005 [Acidobacteriota bacterium]